MVGRNILHYYQKREYEVYAPSSRELDLTKYEDVKTYLKKIDPEMIIHAAGLVGGIQANINNPVDFLTVNTDIARNLILSAREYGVKKLLNIASSCMYPKSAENPLKEDVILDGKLEPTNEGYALAKIYATKLCEYINKENKNFQYRTIIPCNLYGKFDKFSPHNSHMLPAVIRKIYLAKVYNKSTVTIWGDGEARREFMYVEDLADFIYFAIENFYLLPQNINVGLGHDYSINEYYLVVAKVIGYNGDFVHDLDKPVGMHQKLIDNTKIKKMGWQPKFSLEQGIQETFNYFKTLV